MGYPMTYRRVVERNHLEGDYMQLEKGQTWTGSLPPISGIRGDLRRLERDQRDEPHLSNYAQKSGATMEQVKIILDMFFEVITEDAIQNPMSNGNG
jgi:hypothetical protein